MNISQEEWESKMEADATAFVLDVRTEEEFEEGYIPNATNLDIHLGQGFIDGIAKLKADKTYYVYCRSGKRSEQACLLMKGAGLTAYNLMGGILQWQGNLVE